MRFVILALTSLALHAQQPAAAPPPNPSAEVRARYTKFDYRIPMRDGVKLFTSVYVPKDASQPLPMMMQRTPYTVAPYGIDNYPARVGPSELFQKDGGFIFVYQDVRGRNLSEGIFIDVPRHKTQLATSKDTDESTDTYDTVDWLVKNIPNNNGRVGMWGISYPGFYAAFGLINSHPALKAVSPQAPMGDVGNGDDVYHNGAFYLAANFGFFTNFKPRSGAPERPQQSLPFPYGTSDMYDYFLRLGPLANAPAPVKGNPYWEDLLAHPNYDEFWQARALAPHMKNVKPAVLMVGGWFDAEDLAGPLKLFRSLQANGPQAPATLVMGPFSHGAWSSANTTTFGNLNLSMNAGEYYRKEIEFPFFVDHLKGKAAGWKEQAWLFETGTNRWRKFATWPPAEAKARSLYLGEGGKLTFTRPQGSGYDEYVSDPARPVPVSSEIGPGMPGDYMTYDQRFASKRPDVLTYMSDPLEQDVTVTGSITPVLRVSTSGTDSDFVVKLIDVYPDDYPGTRMGGYQQLVRGEPFRGKFRNSMEKPEPFEPNVPAKVEFWMPDVCHTFRPGHRIMVQIQSSWFPLTDRNPQRFVNIPTAKASDFQKATQRVYRGSELRLMVIE